MNFFRCLDFAEKDWISTSDALRALPTHSIMNAREERTPLTLGLAMDFRAYLDPPLPSDYIGNAVHVLNIHIHTTAPPPLTREINNDLVSTIVKTTHQIRGTIQAINGEYIRRIIGALVFHTRVSAANGGRFLTITSWARQPVYELDWGQKVGTRIERVRVLRSQYLSLLLIAPILKGMGVGGVGDEEEEGGVEVIFGLEAGEMEKLKEVGGLVGRFARW